MQSFYVNIEELETEAEPELVVLVKLLSTFGPLPDALIAHVNDNEASEILNGLWEAIRENGAAENFADWTEDVFPNLNDEAKRLILRMTNLDPARRVGISEILTDAYWLGD